MAVTPGGNFYIESSDLVANYPATSLAIANRLDKYALNPYTDATERDFLIQFPVQGQLAQTLDDNKAWKYDGTAWAPFSGASNANFTGAATGTYTDGDSVDWKYITFTSSGTVTFDQAGYMRALVVGAGQNAQSGYQNQWPDSRAAGAAGRVIDGEYKVTATAYTVTIGAAASKPAYGGACSIGTILVSGGGIGSNAYAAGSPNNYGVESDITGTNLEYGYQNNFPNITGSGYGVASQVNQLTGATQGVVVIAVRT